MKCLASITALILSACAYAESMVVPSLPEPLRPCAEAETNVTFSAGAAGDNLWRLSVELDASVGNSVEVVLGIDADGDGALAVEEGELVVDWLRSLDCDNIVLNVAGPRESKSPGIQATTHAFVSRLIDAIRGASANPIGL